MKRYLLTLCTFSILLFSCSDKKKTDEGTSEKKPAEIQPTAAAMPDSATMMKNWQDYMTPGDMHKMMAKWDGAWNGEVSICMYPGSPWQKSTSTAVNKMIMNGLYQQSEHTGEMMGMPFNGQSTVAYDVHLKEFISTWIDNMGSGIMIMKGPWDETTKTITLKGTMIDAGTKMETAVRETFKVIDDNTQEMAMFVMTPDGKEFNTMNIKYTRKK